MEKSEHLLAGCLYFTANRFARTMTKMAEEEFKITGLSPTHAFAVTVVNDFESISAKDLADYLHMAPSTITRFVDKLIVKGLVERKIEGKNSFVIPTEKGKELQETINKAWKSLYNIYLERIGEDKYFNLTRQLGQLSEKLK